MKKRIYLPASSPEELIDLPVSCFLLRHPQGNLLFDTGCHPSVAENPEERWGDLSRVVVPVMVSDDNVLNELRGLNLAPDDIDIVVNSHLHCDHCGCNELFSKATIYIHSEELAFARKPNMEGKGYFEADWKHPQPIVAGSSIGTRFYPHPSGRGTEKAIRSRPLPRAPGLKVESFAAAARESRTTEPLDVLGQECLVKLSDADTVPGAPFG